MRRDLGETALDIEDEYDFPHLRRFAVLHPATPGHASVLPRPHTGIDHVHYPDVAHRPFGAPLGESGVEPRIAGVAVKAPHMDYGEVLVECPDPKVEQCEAVLGFERVAPDIIVAQLHGEGAGRDEVAKLGICAQHFVTHEEPGPPRTCILNWRHDLLHSRLRPRVTSYEERTGSSLGEQANPRRAPLSGVLSSLLVVGEITRASRVHRHCSPAVVRIRRTVATDAVYGRRDLDAAVFRHGREKLVTGPLGARRAFPVPATDVGRAGTRATVNFDTTCAGHERSTQKREVRGPESANPAPKRQDAGITVSDEKQTVEHVGIIVPDVIDIWHDVLRVDVTPVLEYTCAGFVPFVEVPEVVRFREHDQS